MPLSDAVRDREKAKFREVGNDVAVAVVGVDQYGNPIEPVTFAWDSFAVTFPSSTQEVYTFSLASVVVRVITLNYTDGSKKNLLSGLKA